MHLASCIKCRKRVNRFGFDVRGKQRLRCCHCQITFSAVSPLVNGDGVAIRMPMKHERARLLLLKGESIRGTAQIIGISKRTVERVLRDMGDVQIKCPCGQDARHQGWCAFRVARSPARQTFLSRWGMKAAIKASEYQSRETIPAFCVGAADLRTAVAIKRAMIRGVITDGSIALDEYLRASNEAWKMAHALGCRACGTVRKYGGSRCRRCVRLMKVIAETEIECSTAISRPIWRERRNVQLLVKGLAHSRGMSKSEKLMVLVESVTSGSRNITA